MTLLKLILKTSAPLCSLYFKTVWKIPCMSYVLMFFGIPEATQFWWPSSNRCSDRLYCALVSGGKNESLSYITIQNQIHYRSHVLMWLDRLIVRCFLFWISVHCFFPSKCRTLYCTHANVNTLNSISQVWTKDERFCAMCWLCYSWK